MNRQQRRQQAKKHNKTLLSSLHQQLWQQAKLDFDQKNFGCVIPTLIKITKYNKDFTAAWHLLGQSYFHIKHYSDACRAFHRAVSLLPADPVLRYNLGNAYLAYHQNDKAYACFEQARLMGFALSFVGLAKFYRKQGHYQLTIENLLQAYQQAPMDEDILRVTPWLLENVLLQGQNPLLEQLLMTVLATERQHLEKLVYPIFSYLSCHPGIKSLLTVLTVETPLESVLAQIPVQLLVTALCRLPIAHPDIECLIVKLRAYFLNVVEECEATYEILGGLAYAAYYSDYVFTVSDVEEQVLTVKRQAPLTSLSLLQLACYQPLYTLEPIPFERVNPWVQVIYDLQVVQPSKLENYRQQVSSLVKVMPASQQVHQQYEEHPYPKWRFFTTVATPTRVALQQKLPYVSLPQARQYRVLIAGCGTGRQAIKAAYEYQDAEVVAIDLSRTSLAYAQYKTVEQKLCIRYYQADILALPTQLGSFQIIECVGVLHHLVDPFAGMHQLNQVLTEDGVVLLGLYSQRARSMLYDMKSQLPCATTTQEIRAAREQIKKYQPWHDYLQYSEDFYSTAGCRDLLFHTQECAYTLLEVEELLQKVGWRFIRMEALPEEIYQRYHQAYPEGESLRAWHKFEQDHPTVFGRMYQFWCQKI